MCTDITKPITSFKMRNVKTQVFLEATFSALKNLVPKLKNLRTIYYPIAEGRSLCTCLKALL